MRPPEECPKAAPPWSISGPVSGYVCHFLLSCSRSSQVPTPSHYHFYSFSAMNLPLTGGVATFSLTLTPSSQPHTHTHEAELHRRGMPGGHIVRLLPVFSVMFSLHV